MLDSIYHMTLNLLTNRIILREHFKILLFFTQRYNGQNFLA